MMNDFYTNLTTITNNLEDITFTKYATITNLNSDGTCTAKEDEEEGLTHENINTLGNNLRVGDKVVLGFVDNSIYNPVILTGGEESYTKTETDALLQKKINEPINEGTNGQVLTTDGAGGRTWKTVQIPSGVVVDLNLDGTSNNAVANSAVVGGLNDKIEASDISFGFDADTKEIYIEVK